ncbi:MAG: hypothetical protein KA243_02385 [Candidatus Aminicenantes bacterium]|nr:hypothetical protein [Candidatus Aminicenantes bacterium]NLH77585.1 hypothetical protein [Acidobacteriota bacterium]
MSDAALFPLTWRVVRRRLAGTPPAVAAGLALPAVIAAVGIADSYATAAKLFFFLLPHVFLVAAQDVLRTDIDSGVLENALFAGGRFRDYLKAKIAVVAAASAVYATVLFGLFSAWGLATGRFEARFAARFGLALLAGLYYVAMAGVLSRYLRAGSNVLAVLLAQTALLIGLVASASPRAGLLDYAATGRFPGPGPALVFAGLTAVLPNVIVYVRQPLFAVEVAAGLLAGCAVLDRIVGRLELRRPA